jgi:hypothetical protein
MLLNMDINSRLLKVIVSISLQYFLNMLIHFMQLKKVPNLGILDTPFLNYFLIVYIWMIWYEP